MCKFVGLGFRKSIDWIDKEIRPSEPLGALEGVKEGPQVSGNPERLELNPYCGLAALCSSPWSCGILLRSQKPIQSQLAKGGGESGSLRPALEMQPGAKWLL